MDARDFNNMETRAVIKFFIPARQGAVNKYILCRGADKSLARPGRKEPLRYDMDARDFNNMENRTVIKFFFLQGKAPKEIHAILTETLACFLPGRAKELSALLLDNELYVWAKPLIPYRRHLTTYHILQNTDTNTIMFHTARTSKSIKLSPMLKTTNVTYQPTVSQTNHNSTIQYRTQKSIIVSITARQINPSHKFSSWTFLIRFNIISDLCLHLRISLFVSVSEAEQWMNFLSFPFPLHVLPIVLLNWTILITLVPCCTISSTLLSFLSTFVQTISRLPITLALCHT